ncbi:ATP/GTP-binding protein [Streptomonospora wellingtoniae]|uniref:ATP/GTP-binding protein n=1 Tax=Streptomonospora wellingtoniae TaxID=3075544 RepID=A0ABU2KRI2_9ACTN|nr:ATP/GTP-binding protein [Streptomonospora sp. DSM 45055]MDT0301738.1 ATP/GTP-binding protein [Streptomonospora sp. DSM 45055]
MSPRRNSPRRRNGQSRPPGDDEVFQRITGAERRENGPDGEWAVRRISGSAATKTYRCPGCHQEIPPAVPHVVAWRPFGDGDDRRHWHSSCWEHRTSRGVRFPRR